MILTKKKNQKIIISEVAFIHFIFIMYLDRI